MWGEETACVIQGSFILRRGKFLLISGWPWWLRNSSFPHLQFPHPCRKQHGPPFKGLFSLQWSLFISVSSHSLILAGSPHAENYISSTSSCCPHVPGTVSRTWALSSDIHSFSKYLGSASYMQGTFPGTNKYLCPCGGAILVEDTDKLTIEWIRHFQKVMCAENAVKKSDVI